MNTLDGLTLEDIEKMKEQMKEKAVMPKTVNSKKEARLLTKNDLLGRKWKKGDEYYVAVSSDYSFVV